jgi:predicted lactoylglutathione lyase
MHTLYIDKPMQGHNLMQAIARVNRVYKDKPGGLVVDYLGIASDLKKALSFYSDSGGKGDPALAQEQAVALMLEKLEVVSQMYHSFAYEAYFEADTRKKLSIILEAEEHILGLEDGKKRYIDEVTALSQAFSIAVPHEEAMDVKDEVSFFQAVKARLVKFDTTGSGRSDEEMETTIRQVIDKALVTEQVTIYLYLADLWYYPRGPVADAKPLVIDMQSREIGYYHVPTYMADERGDLVFQVPLRALLAIDSWVHVFIADVVFGVFASGVRAEKKLEEDLKFKVKLISKAVM